MLRDDVVQAVEEGKFHVYPIETIDQGIELLTDMPAGEPDAEGIYPEDTLNGKVQARLVKFADTADSDGSEADEESTGGEKKDKSSKEQKE
jgi:U3 small nucleolar ribonucleoprotein component